MKSHYTCGSCEQSLAATAEHWMPHSLKRAGGNDHIATIGQCKACARAYGEKYRQALRARGVTRSQKHTLQDRGAVTGTVYVIGAEDNTLPCKIGITSGRDVRRRLSALQTAHWIKLGVIWRSDLLVRADLVEQALHRHFDQKRVRGEWFTISQEDIDTIPLVIEQWHTKNPTV
jgi:hypothetical protein